MHSRIIVGAGALLFAAPLLSAAALAGPSASSATPAAADTKVQTRYPLRVFKRVTPLYPALPNTGEVGVETCFTVNADGSVSDARVTKIHFYLTDHKSIPGPRVQHEFEKSTLDAIRE